MTSEHEDSIDWRRTSWEGSRREQLRRWQRLTIAQRFEALEEMHELSRTLSASTTNAATAPQTPPDSVRETSAYYLGHGDTQPRHEVVLAGCNPTPLASYLKALGVLRLVAEQADPDARGFWRNDQFVLTSRLDTDALREFFLEKYQPTPVLAPWNGGSGFYAGDNQSGIQPIEASEQPRFEPLAESIRVIRQTLYTKGLQGRPEGEDKAALLAALRAELSDHALQWFDAAVVLTEDNPRYPPLLGTGGNDGRLDFTNNFLQRLVELFDPTTGAATPETRPLFDEALMGRTTASMDDSAIGQFSPGAAGGPNQTTGFDAKARTNPWDFVFMLEGALLFAAAATRRLATDTRSALSYPFTVRPTGAGSGAAALGDEANARAELWAPLWRMPASLPELQTLLNEGRATLGRRPVVDGLDFARAIARLGVDRGIEGFQRYAFLMRSGKAYFATPLNRIHTSRNPAGDLVNDLEHRQWLERFRRFARSNSANRVVSLATRLENAIFELAVAREHAAPSIRELIAILGQIQLYLAHGPKARESCGPVPRLSQEWLTRADDNSPEFAIAATLAGLHGEATGNDGRPRRWLMPMREHLAPERAVHNPVWDEHAAQNVTWGVGSVETNLIATLQRRLLIATQRDNSLVDKPLAPARCAPLAAIAAWLEDSLDTQRIASLLPGLMLVRMPAGATTGITRTTPLPAAYRVLKPFFCTQRQLERSGVVAPGSCLSIPPELIRRLAGDQIDVALTLALRKLRVAGIGPDFHDLTGAHINGPRLIAALMAPITDHDLQHLLPASNRQQAVESATN